MNQTKNISVKGKRVSLGLVALAIPLTILLATLGNRCLYDLGDLFTPPDQNLIRQEYRDLLQERGEELQKIWREAQPGIEASIDAQARATLLDETVPLAYDGEWFFLGVPDPTQRQSVDRLHRQAIQKALREASGTELKLSVQLYRDWKWLDPLEVELGKRETERDKLTKQLEKLRKQTPRLENEYKNQSTNLAEIRKTQDTKSKAGEPLLESEREELNRRQAATLERQQALDRHLERVRQVESDLEEIKEEFSILEQTIADRDAPADAAYQEARKAHKTRVFWLRFLYAAFLLLAAAYLAAQKRKSRYALLYAAFGLAGVWVFWTFLQWHVSPRLINYLARILGIAVLATMIVGLLRSLHVVSSQRLMKQIREALLAKRCPNCSFPFYEGRAAYEVLGLDVRRILKFATSKSVQVVKTDESEHHFCQNCGLPITDTCVECGTHKYALLPHCPKCNAQTDVVEAYQTYLDGHGRDE